MSLRARLSLLLAFCVCAAPAVALGGRAGGDSAEGVLRSVHGDRPGATSTRFDYVLDTASGQVHVDLNGADPGRLLGRRVRVSGARRGGVLVAADAGSTRATGAAAASYTGARTVAVVLLNFSNDASTPWTADQVRGIMFSNASSVASYYANASYGKLSLSGTVYDWTQVGSTNAGCNYTAWANDAAAKLKQKGVDLSVFDHVVYAWPRTPDCGWAGMGQLPGRLAWIDGYLDLRVVGHELGHNLGVHHASSLSCTDTGGLRVSYSSSCAVSEYGDPFTIMGNASTRLSHNLHRVEHGWASDVQTVTANGSYTLAPSEGSATTRTLRIARGDGTYLWLENRQPGATFDTFGASDPAVTGVTVRIAPDASVITQSKLLDMTPDTTSYADAPLAVGKSWTDPVGKVTITTQSSGSTGATVGVSFRADTQAPTTPGALSATTPTATSVKLTWTASTDDRAVAGYRVSRNGVLLGTVTSTAYTDSGLQGATTYSYTVVAVDPTGNASAPASTSVTTPTADSTAPTAPSSLAASVSSRNVALTWTAATDNVGVAQYRILRNGRQVGTSTTTSFGQRVNRGTYTYTVVAVDAAGNVSAASNAVGVRV